jgi:predicted Zn finger-like uncharacterized protein
MRLQCPNCDAEYEVDAAAIPQVGRDVQCSNCGHGWFQMHPDFAPDPEMESALYDPPPPLPQARPGEGAYPRREIDPAAMQILREEAAREEALRARDLAAKAQSNGQNARTMPAVQAVGQGGGQAVAQVAQADARITMPARAAMRRIHRVKLQGDDLEQDAAVNGGKVGLAQPAATQPADAPSPPTGGEMIDPNLLQSTIRQQISAQQKQAEAGFSDARNKKDQSRSTDSEVDDSDRPNLGRYIGMAAGIVLAAVALAIYVFARHAAAHHKRHAQKPSYQAHNAQRSHPFAAKDPREQRHDQRHGRGDDRRQ